MIALLGTGGMLGSMLAETINLDFDALNRPEFDAANPQPDILSRYDRVINCIGVIKPHCDDIPNATKVNALFPHTLPPTTIQIATDCVFSGLAGDYVETDPHDATDVYGKTKSLGEAPHIKNLRCSIIGPEIKNHLSLLDWFLSQKKANGFINHWWNGITTLHFARICEGAIKNNLELPTIQHVVPADKVTKAELLRLIAKEYGKNIPVKDVEADEPTDRTLSTNNPEINLELWQAAGYKQPPTIAQMIKELASL